MTNSGTHRAASQETSADHATGKTVRSQEMKRSDMCSPRVEARSWSHPRTGVRGSVAVGEFDVGFGERSFDLADRRPCVAAERDEHQAERECE
ncbi:hypothetical protein GCM10027436_65510 [Actinophytocola sediminis]